MESLRRQQVNEVLDEDRRINERVYQSEQDQVRTFQESVKPKTPSNIETEVKFDKLVGQLNGLLSAKLNTIENILKPFGTSKETEARNRDIINNTSDILNTYNEAVRAIIRPDNTPATSSALKSKIQEIDNNINALVYAYSELFKKDRGIAIVPGAGVAKTLPRTLSASAVFSAIQAQLFRGVFQPLTSQDIQASYNKVRADLPAYARTLLDGIESTNDLASLATKTNKALSARTADGIFLFRKKMIEDEQGRPLSPAEIAILRNSLFGVSKNDEFSPVDAEAIHRQDQLISADRRAMADYLEKNPQRVQATPRFSSLPEELRQYVEKTEGTRHQDTMRKLNDDFVAIRNKYKVDVPAPSTIRRIRQDAEMENLMDLLKEATINRLRENGEDADPDAIESDIQDRYESLLARDSRSDKAKKVLFLDQLESLLTEIEANVGALSEQQRNTAVESSNRQIPIEGQGKPLGLEYDEEKASLIPSASYKIPSEQRPPPGFFERQTMKKRFF